LEQSTFGSTGRTLDGKRVVTDKREEQKHRRRRSQSILTIPERPSATAMKLQGKLEGSKRRG
jgi:hypothetical protein